MPASLPYCNSHTHFDSNASVFTIPDGPSVISVFAEDMAEVVSMMKQGGEPEQSSFSVCTGVHPWTVATLTETTLPEHLSLVEQALEQSQKGELPCNLVAVGECGYDLYGENRRATEALQHEALHAHMDLALQYGKPLVIHCVKGFEQLLKHHHDLRKLPAVIFHGYGGSCNEADTFLRRGINAYFSFGPALLNRRGWPPRVLAALPEDRILLETDDQSGRQNPVTIEQVYQVAAEIKNAATETLQQRVLENYCVAFNIRSV